jgi:hypothetical protein
MKHQYRRHSSLLLTFSLDAMSHSTYRIADAMSRLAAAESLRFHFGVANNREIV